MRYQACGHGQGRSLDKRLRWAWVLHGFEAIQPRRLSPARNSWAVVGRVQTSPAPRQGRQGSLFRGLPQPGYDIAFSALLFTGQPFAGQ